MSKIKVNQLGAGALLSYLSQGLQILITLFYTPVMLRLLGQSEYGVYQIAFSVVGMLSLFTFGFSNSYVNFFTQAKNEAEPQKKIASLNGMFLLVFGALGLLVLAVGGFLTFQAQAVLGGKLTAEELAIGKKLLAVMVVNCALSFPAAVYSNHIIANEKFVPLQLVSILGTVLNPCLTFPLLLLGHGSLAMALVMLGVTLFKLVASALYCHLRLGMRFSFRALDFALFRNVGAFSLFIFIESLASTINVGIDRFLLGQLVGSVAAAVYAVGGQINTLYTSLSTSISSVFQPRIHRMVHGKEGDQALSELFIRVGKIQFSLLYLALCGFAVFGRRFMAIWAGEGYEKAFWVAVVLLIPITPHLIQNMAIEIQRAKGLQKYRSLMCFGIAVLNLVSSIFLIRAFGEIGAALGTALAWVLAIVAMDVFYAKRVGLDVKAFWIEILWMGKGGILPLACGFLLLPIIERCRLVWYFALMAAFAILYVISMYFLGLRRSDRAALRAFLKKETAAK